MGSEARCRREWGRERKGGKAAAGRSAMKSAYRTEPAELSKRIVKTMPALP